MESMLELMGMMFLLMMTGLFLRRREIITPSGKQCLTDLILCAILPSNIVKAFCIEVTPGFWQRVSLVFLVSVGIQIFYLLINRTCYGMMQDGEKQVYQYGTVCSNSGFMGNPLAQGVFGDIGLLYASVFLIPQRIVMWTAGVTYFTREKSSSGVWKKVLLHPCMVAVYIGLFLMVTQLPLPGVLMQTISSLSGATTPLTMLYIGTILVDVNLKELFTGKQLYFSFIRLIGAPLAVWLVCMALHLDRLVSAVSVFLTAMPAGSTTSLLAAKYGADENSAARSIVVTTVFSTVTLTVWSLLLTKWAG